MLFDGKLVLVLVVGTQVTNGSAVPFSLGLRDSESQNLHHKGPVKGECVCSDSEHGRQIGHREDGDPSNLCSRLLNRSIL